MASEWNRLLGFNRQNLHNIHKSSHGALTSYHVLYSNDPKSYQ
jgi:hypothetical protein